MGSPDTIEYVCPYCGHETEAQTKLGECTCLRVHPPEWMGMNIPELKNAIVAFKTACHNCGNSSSMCFLNWKLVAVVGYENATHREEFFGEFSKIRRLKNGN